MKSFAKFNLQAQKDFFQTLKDRVNAYFTQNQRSPFGNFRLYFKTLVMYAVYVTPIVLVYLQWFPFWLNWMLYLVAGVGVAGIGMGVMHDAVHGSYSRNRFVNKLLGYSMELLGGSSFNWKVQHNVLHHTYTNVAGMDQDITDKPILRFEPTAKWRPINRFQHIYAFFMYTLMTLSWIVRGDAVQLKEYNEWGLTRQMGASPVREAIRLICTKTLYLSFFFVLPIAVLGMPWWEALVGFVLMHMVAGFIMAVVFQLAHVVEPADYPQPDDKGDIENSWAVHQLYTTADFGKSGYTLLSWYMGGLNYQVEHHLFPNISHIHYPKIAPIVEQTAREFQLPYHKFASMRAALASHYRQLKEFGKKPEPTIAQPATVEQEELQPVEHD